MSAAFGSPERRLGAAILLSAIEDATRALPWHPRLRPYAQVNRYHALAWLVEAQTDEDVPVSFATVCSWCGLSPDHVRKTLAGNPLFVRHLAAFQPGQVPRLPRDRP